MTSTYFLHLTPQVSMDHPAVKEPYWSPNMLVEAVIYQSREAGISGPTHEDFMPLADVLTWLWRAGFVPSQGAGTDSEPFGPLCRNGFTTTTLRRLNDPVVATPLHPRATNNQPNEREIR